MNEDFGIKAKKQINLAKSRFAMHYACMSMYLFMKRKVFCWAISPVISVTMIRINGAASSVFSTILVKIHRIMDLIAQGNELVLQLI